jgi:asparagine synthetase B (glutamine-hydrolysing)
VREILNYNFVPGDVRDGDFDALYRRRRRDSVFAFAYRNEAGETIALRDHLGIVPLYYRQTVAGPRFSLALDDLVDDGDELDERGAELFLAFGTARLGPPVRGVGIVPAGTVVRFAAGGGPPEVLYEYAIEPGPPLPLSLEELADEADRLMQRSVERTLESDSVGLYLSGGIDSALVAIYLKRAGAAVSAYTSAPWGEGGAEVPFAKMNAELAGVDRHTIVPLDTARYAHHVRESGRLYGGPHAVTTMIGVASLYEGSGIGDEQQVYLGHNTDTMTCSTGSQYLVYFTHRLPRALKRRLHPTLCHTSPLSDFLSFQSQGRVTEHERFARAYGHLEPIQLLTLAASYVTQTPAHSEVLVQPVLRQGALAADPYYDMDLFELCLRMPLRHRVRATRESKIGIAMEKRVFRKLAERYLPPEIVHRKKAFTIPFARDDASRAYEAALPTSFDGRSVTGLRERFAAEVLGRFASDRGLAAARPGAG